MLQSQPVSQLLEERIAAGDFPSAVHLVAEKGEPVFGGALGLAVRNPAKVEAEIDTIYDLASLTKVLVTGLILAKLIQDGRLSSDSRLSERFPEFAGGDKASVTIGQLASHTSGFKAWLPFYIVAAAAPADRERAVLMKIAEEPLENAPGTKVVYSDLNFIILGLLIEKMFEAPISDVADELIFRPLGLRNTFFNPPESAVSRIAASESGNGHERKTCGDMGFDTSAFAWRSGVIRGEVHDGNCHYLGGASGHAGLFGTAADVLEIAKQFLPATTRILKPETCTLFRTDMTPHLNESRSLAFQLASTPDSTASPEISADGFGHLGFTGTSLWIDPATDRIFILLTNRTHDHGLPFANINHVRRSFNATANKALDDR